MCTAHTFPQGTTAHCKYVRNRGAAQTPIAGKASAMANYTGGPFGIVTVAIGAKRLCVRWARERLLSRSTCKTIVLRIALLYYRTRTVRRTIDSKFYEKVGHFPQDPPCFCPRTGCHCLNAQHGCSTTPFLIVGRQQRAAASSRAQQMPQAAPNDRNEH